MDSSGDKRFPINTYNDGLFGREMSVLTKSVKTLLYIYNNARVNTKKLN